MENQMGYPRLFNIVPLLFLFLAQVSAAEVPVFEIDATWPKALPEGMINGQIAGNCADAHDHIAIIDVRNITEEEMETSSPTPPVIIFDINGNIVDSWGDPNVLPNSAHGCVFDSEHNLYIAGNGDAVVQKYSHEGELLLQIGEKGLFDTRDGSASSESLNSSRSRLSGPAAIAIDSVNGDIYIADGYGNRRVVVFDKNGEFLRQWGGQASQDDIESGEPTVFAQVVHCVVISNAGLVYVCDRQGDRIQVFDKNGGFVRNIWVRTGSEELPDARGSVWSLAFSGGKDQSYLYVVNGRNERIHIVDHETGRVLSSFGRPGHQAGNFTHAHTIAVDSEGSLYIAETGTGRRIQKFRLSE